MNYMHEIAYKIMDEMSEMKPVIFHRDGNLYFSTEKGFVVMRGVNMYDDDHLPYEMRKLHGEKPEAIRLSSNSLLNDGKIKKAQLKRFKPLVYGPDDSHFTLEDITNAARELSELKDDGKIRIIHHESRYHSHKYGYAADGTDVFATIARVMDKNLYFSMMRHKEHEIFNIFESLRDEVNNSEHSFELEQRISKRFDSFKMPDCSIVTKDILVSFPRKGYLQTVHKEFWSENESLSSNPVEYDESRLGRWPYAVFTKIHSHEFNTRDGDIADIGECNKRINSQLEAINSFTNSVNIAVNQYNWRYEEIHREEFKRRKEIAMAAKKTRLEDDLPF